MRANLTPDSFVDRPASDRNLHLLNALVAAGQLAPSGDNTQPWQFTIAPEHSQIHVQVDESRDLSPMNVGARMSRIAVGAAVENVVQAAAFNGWGTHCETAADGAHVTIAVSQLAGERCRIPDALHDRVTNRRPFDGRTLPHILVEQLRESTVVDDSTGIAWLTEQSAIDQLASIIAQSDELMFTERSIRQAFLQNVRFHLPDAVPPEHGLSLACLEAHGADRYALEFLRGAPQWLCRLARIGRQFGAKSRMLVNSASGLCLITASDDEPATDIAVGRTVERTWLQLAATGLAAQPMMSPLVIESALLYGSQPLLDSLGREAAMRLSRSLREFVSEVVDGRPAFLLRFGYSDSPSGRTGRLPVAASVIQGR